MFWYIKEAIDAYFEGRPFTVTVKAGCIIGRKLEGRPTEPDEVELELDDGLEDFDEIDTGLPMPPRNMATGSVADEIGEGDVIEEQISIDQELDAFIDGKQRPAHLDRRPVGDESDDGDLGDLDELGEDDIETRNPDDD